MNNKPFYITTPIYYPSDKLHIGHAYCTVATDAIARYKRQRGFDVYFLTGADEHGQKIERKAKERGVTPQEYVDHIVDGFVSLWKLMDVSYDGFIRTTDPLHVACVQRIFKQLYEQGDIYKDAYEGHYCTPCESFWLERQLKDGCCPDCNRPVELVQEESYYFRLSKYADRLIAHIRKNPDFIQPPSRANEMLQNFLLPGLEDLCVSRTSFQWGVPVDFDEKHVVYVWVDALSNYISALGYGTEDDTLYQKYWPADVQIVGKEIVRFHTIIWPILLMALGQPLPKQVFGHGWLVLDGGKMSKSKGNVVDPVQLCARYGVDALRYFLLREVPFGSDGVFSNETLIYRINNDLANDLGNLLSRTVAMIDKYFGGEIPAPDAINIEVDDSLFSLAARIPSELDARMDTWHIPDAIAEINRLVSACNKYIDVTAPWLLAKTEEGKRRLATVLYNLAECLRVAAILLIPFLTQTPGKIFAQLGTPQDLRDIAAVAFGQGRPGAKVEKGEALFPRIDLEKELAELGAAGAPKEIAPACEIPPIKEEIGYDDFSKVDFRLAKVLACEEVPKAKKLLKLQLAVGGETRTVVSGIKKWYAPTDLVGKTVVLVANLKPATICGVESRGMILCASDEGDLLSVVGPMVELPDGLVVR
ncbi:MAG: methionine--tRNA ligase [Clostridiales bacterium]|nr:methionine--tRNA ligase [Clostridiales bacterium]